MKTNNILAAIATTAILGLSSTTANAQLNKGNLLISSNFTNLELNAQKDLTTFQFNIKPRVGYFFKDNWVSGLYSNFGINSNKYQHNNTGGLGVFSRYYFNNINTPVITQLRFFAEGHLGFLDAYTKVMGAKINSSAIQLGITAGASYFISANVGLEVALGYEVSQGISNSDYFNNRLNFEVGLQVYLPTARVKGAYKQLKSEVK